MKRNTAFLTAIAATVMILAVSGPASAYTVTGALSNSGITNLSGAQTYTGSLSGLFDTSGDEALYINNNLSTGKYNDMVANQDYIVATNATGQTATFSAGEITVGFANPANPSSSFNSITPNPIGINISGNSGSGYNITETSGGLTLQSLSNITNINVIPTSMPAGPGGYATSLTISGNVPTPVTYTSTNFPGTYHTFTAQEAYGYTGNQYTGASLYTMLQKAGVNMNNLNQYLIATGTDGGEAVISMDEIIANQNSDMVAYLLNSNALSSTRGYFRLVLPTDNASSRSIFTLSSLTVNSSVPIPAPAWLLGSGLAGMMFLKRRYLA